jgi:hypothetical protein
MNRNLVRLAGPLLGAVCGVAVISIVNDSWGLVAGGVVFLGCAAGSDWIWRRKATGEQIRQDLEDRTRNTFP